MTRAMRPHPFRLLAIAALALFAAGCETPPPTTSDATATADQPLPLIPMPAQVERSAGHFVLRPGAPLLVRSDDAEAAGIARRFASLTERTRHISLDVRLQADSDDTEGAIVLRLADDANAPDGEGYRLVVDDDHILIAARDPAGLYYGTITLWQLLTARNLDASQARVPALEIKDRPRFAWRGFMLDSSRHFQTVAEIKKIIDWMSLHKLNVFHWHLTDDQGWRLQIKQYPKLTEIGSCREAVGPDAAYTGGPDKPYCGYYTQDDAREIVRYAAKHFITVVPEIEIPGHAQAAIASYPDLGVTGQRLPVSTDWGINPWLYAPNQHSLKFLENVLDEVMAIFPSTYIHVGGDEADKAQWKASAKTQAKRKKLGLDDMDDLQGWMIGKIGAYLEQHGRKLIGWDEILEGPIPSNATVMSWRGIKGGIEAANKGHDVVLAPAPTMYLDYLQSSAHDEPPGRPTISTLKDIYSFDPIPEDIPTSKAKHVLGLQVNLWAEYMPTFERIQHAMFPRLSAVAELAWSPSSATDWNRFLERMPMQLMRYRALGINYADSAWEPRFKLSPEGDKIKVSIRNQVDRGRIRYTTDGGEPIPTSAIYDQPLELTPPVKLRAATYDGEGRRLAAPRTQPVNTVALLTRNSDQLESCGDNLTLRLEDDRPLDGSRPIYNVDIADMCWQWKAAPVEGTSKIAVTVGNLPWNYALASDQDIVVVHPQTGEYPSLNIYRDSCDGEKIAQLSLHEASKTRLQTTLSADMPDLSGKHDLCFIITGDVHDSFWGIDTVKLTR